jgi:hypothetical protein
MIWLWWSDVVTICRCDDLMMWIFYCVMMQLSDGWRAAWSQADTRSGGCPPSWHTRGHSRHCLWHIRPGPGSACRPPGPVRSQPGTCGSVVVFTLIRTECMVVSWQPLTVMFVNEEILCFIPPPWPLVLYRARPLELKDFIFLAETICM